jgi:hypothetical protein
MIVKQLISWAISWISDSSAGAEDGLAVGKAMIDAAARRPYGPGHFEAKIPRCLAA